MKYNLKININIKLIPQTIAAILISILCGCNKTDSANLLESEIKAVTSYTNKTKTEELYMSDGQLVFTGNDIDWFNPDTREIKFINLKPGVFSIPIYAQIDVNLNDETLFAIVACINGSVSRSYDDLVLFYDSETSKYYLHDNYPDYWDLESTQKNIEKRSVGWNKFLEQLKKEGRLK